MPMLRPLIALLAAQAALTGCSSHPSPPAAFHEDFEGYQAGQVTGAAWTVETSPGATAAVDTSQARSGSKSVRIHTPAGTGTKTAFVRLAGAGGLPAAGNAFFGRMMFLLESAPEAADPAVHWTFVQAGGVVAGQTYRALYRYGGQHPVIDGAIFAGSQLMANYETPDWYEGVGPGSDCWHHANRVVVPVGRWTCAEWQFDGPADSMRFWLNGAAVESLTVSGTGEGCVNQPSDYPWTAPVFDHLDLGWQSYQPDAARTIWIDDVAIAPTRIGCP
jgi:hypothetical protein